MKWQSKQSFIVIGFLLGVVILCWAIIRGDGPRYKGRNASQWLTEGARRKGLAAEYPEAVKQLHTNFIPVFLQANPYENSAYIDWVERTGIPFFERLPSPLQNVLPEPVSRVDLYRAAVTGFAYLGRVAPKQETAELLKESIRQSPVGEHEWRLRFLYSYVTGERNPVQIPIKCLKHPDFAVRFEAAWMATSHVEYSPPSKMNTELAMSMTVLSEALTNTAQVTELFGNAQEHWRKLVFERLNRISPEIASKLTTYLR